MAGNWKFQTRSEPTRAQRFQQSFENFIANHPNGASGIFAGFGDGGGMGMGGGAGNGGGKKKPQPPVVPPTQPESYQWTFPQYSQTWAFTPPNPTPYMNPAPFDPKKYGDPFSKKNNKV